MAPPANHRLVVVAALLAMAVLITLSRLTSFGEPLERDLATYSVVARGLAEGRPLYADLWDHKPPGVHLAFWLAQQALDVGPTSIYALGVSMSLVTLVGVYAAASATALGWPVGLLAALLWTVVQADIRMFANQPNTEVFLNAAGIWFLVALVRMPAGARAGLASGALLGLAMLFKPVAACWGLAWLGEVARADPGRRRRGLEMTAVGSLVALAAVGTASLCLWATGVGEAAWNAVVVYNRFYGGSLAANLARGLVPQAIFHQGFVGMGPLGVAALLAAIAPLRGVPLPYRPLVLYLAGCWLAVCLPGRFYSHYYQLVLPGLCVAAAWGVGTITLQREGWKRFAVVAALLWAVIGLQVPAHTLDPDQWSVAKYGDRFVDSHLVGGWIAHVLDEGETFFQWGTDTGLYYSSGVMPAAGILYDGPVVEGPLASDLSGRLLDSLRERPPDLVVVTSPVPGEHAFARWLERGYESLPPDRRFERFQMHVRRGSALEARLAQRERHAASS